VRPIRATGGAAALLLLAPLLAGCADAREPGTLGSAILHGAPAMHGAWPGVGWLDLGCTGVLVAPDMIIYAAHCGEDAHEVFFGEDVEVNLEGSHITVSGAAASLATRWCKVHPDAYLSSGSDIAFCILEPTGVDQRFIPPPALGCFHEAVGIGTEAALVAFGLDDGAHPLGKKRVVHAPVVNLGPEIEIGDGEAGTCAGDSGSPAFVKLPSVTPSPVAQWSLLGILSSGTTGDGCGKGYYTDLATTVGWLEAESQRDLSPCFSTAGNWSPSANCRNTALDPDGVPTAEPAARYSSACGPPFESSIHPTGGCQAAPGAGSVAFSRNACLLIAMLFALSSHRLVSSRNKQSRRGSTGHTLCRDPS
jgi:hypothetical protein